MILDESCQGEALELHEAIFDSCITTLQRKIEGREPKFIERTFLSLSSLLVNFFFLVLALEKVRGSKCEQKLKRNSNFVVRHFEKKIVPQELLCNTRKLNSHVHDNFSSTDLKGTITCTAPKTQHSNIRQNRHRLVFQSEILSQLHLVQHNNSCHMAGILLNSFHLNGYPIRFHLKTYELEPPYTE